jgi:glycosyltransferase involved in cell wall biosynthesis
VRIAANLWQFIPGQVGGQESYIRAVVGGLAARHEVTVFCLENAASSVRRFAPEAEARTIRWAPDGSGIDAALDPAEHDVLLCPQMGLGPPAPPLPAAACVPDVMPRLAPSLFDQATRRAREKLLRATSERADVVFAGSEFTRDAIVEHYPIEASRVIVTYCDADPAFRLRTPLAPAVEEYLLYPANYWPHKNHANLLAAIALIAPRRPGLRLVLTGAESPDAARVRALIAELGVGERVRMERYMPVDELARLMRGARAVVYPSLIEGFGIPAVEAFNAGVPVIAPARGACLEVAGDAAFAIDPDRPESIAAAIERVLDDSELRAELCRRGRVRAALFSWERTIAIVERALATIANQTLADSGASSAG